MARRVFFSFRYKYVWKVNQIRNAPNVIGTSAAGFADASLWEEAKKKGDAAIKKMIDDALYNTSVTVVCITLGTLGRKYIDYEIDQSLKRGNGLLGLEIHHLKDSDGSTGSPGAHPPKIEANGFKVYKFTTLDKLSERIEEAAKLAGK